MIKKNLITPMPLTPQTVGPMTTTNSSPGEAASLAAGGSLYQLCAAACSGKAESSRSRQGGRDGTVLCGQHGGHSVALPSLHPKRIFPLRLPGHHMIDRPSSDWTRGQYLHREQQIATLNYSGVKRWVGHNSLSWRVELI